MSLFKLCERWLHSLPGQEIDQRHVAVQGEFIFVAAYSGMLRVFKPAMEQQALLIEKDVGMPILQIAVKESRLWMLTLHALTLCDIEQSSLRMQSPVAFKEPVFQMSITEGVTVIMHLSTRITLVNEQSTAVVELGHMLFPQPIPIIAQGLVWLTSASLNLQCYSLTTLRSGIPVKSPEHEIELGQEPIYYKSLDKSMWIVTHSEMLHYCQDQLHRKRFDFEIAAALVYANQMNEAMIVIVSTQNTLLVYKYFKMFWAALTHCRPTALFRLPFAGVEGHLLVLSDQQVMITALGTHAAPPQIKQDEKDAVEVQQEYLRVLQAIGGAAPKNQEVLLEVEGVAGSVGKACQFIEDDQGLLKDQKGVVACQITLKLKAKQPLAKLTCTFKTPDNVTLSDPILNLPNLSGAQTLTTEAYTSMQMFPSCATVSANISYLQNSRLQSVTCSFELPASMFLSVVDSSKEAAFKMVFTMDEDPGSISRMFGELPVRGSVAGNTYSFGLPNGVITSIVLAKSSNRMRLQSEFFEGMCFLMGQLERRVQGKLKIDQIPLEEFFQIFEEHYNLTAKLGQLEKQLETGCTNFTIVQKHLIARFKQRVSQDNTSLQSLLEQAIAQIHRLSEQCDNIRTQLDITTHRLSVAARLVMTLVRIKTASIANLDMLEAVLLPDGEGWHQRINAIGDIVAGGGVQSMTRAKKIQMFVLKRILDNESFE